jgi:hypothetical protein
METNIAELEGIIKTLETQVNAGRNGSRGKRFFDDDGAAWLPRPFKRDAMGGWEKPRVVNLQTP